MTQPPVSIVIPTRDRPAYLDVTLASVMDQAHEAGGEVIVVDDGTDPQTAEVAAGHGARRLSGDGRGANAARNAGIAGACGELVVLIDDDIPRPGRLA